MGTYTIAAVSALEVRGPTLTLRYPRASDAATIFELASDPEVTRFFSWGPYRKPEEVPEFLAGVPATRRRGEELALAIVRGDELVGMTALMEFSLRDRRAFVGTWLGRRHWGTGVNLEAKALVCALAFGPLGLERVGAYSATGNPRSQAALERIGFVHEGVFRRWHRHGDEVHDVHVFGLLRSDWERSPLHDVSARIVGRPPRAFVAG